MSRETLSDKRLQAYQRDGYLMFRGLFDAEEMDLLYSAAKADRALEQSAYARDDGEGGKVRLSLWNHPGDNIYGMFSRSSRVVDVVEQLLGEEVYHYHSKMIMKQAHTGGAWAWHQDYGYWYENGVLRPDLCSVFTAVDRATKENGCLQVVRASHDLGRLTHVKVGDQTGADPERVQAVLEQYELVYCEMDPGDSVFFHGNLLHRSDQNESEHDRWSLVCCYNARSNSPVRDGPHPRYTPLAKVDEGAIRRMGPKGFGAGEREDSSFKSGHEQTANRIVE